MTTCFSRQSPTGALMPVSPMAGIHSLSWTLMTCPLSNVVIRLAEHMNDNDFLIFACVSGYDKAHFCFPLQF